jgi:uncharacterized protein
MPAPSLAGLIRRAVPKASPLVARLPREQKQAQRIRRKIRVCAHDVASPRIDSTLEGVRIGQLSDIHVRGGVKPAGLHVAIELMNEQAPDFVVLTGDYVSFSSFPLPRLTSALKKLNRPAYATLGNHDHWSNPGKVRAALENAGITVLQNETAVVQAGRGKIHLVGVDDSVTRNHDPERAFAGVPEDATRIVLSHDPKSADFLHAYDPALILSGHTHGGQMFFKGLTPFVASAIGIKYLHGFFEVKGSVLYVTRGLGASVPVRYRAPWEIAVLTLRSAAANYVALPGSPVAA